MLEVWMHTEDKYKNFFFGGGAFLHNEKDTQTIWTAVPIDSPYLHFGGHYFKVFNLNYLPVKFIMKQLRMISFSHRTYFCRFEKKPVFIKLLWSWVRNTCCLQTLISRGLGPVWEPFLWCNVQQTHLYPFLRILYIGPVPTVVTITRTFFFPRLSLLTSSLALKYKCCTQNQQCSVVPLLWNAIDLNFPERNFEP